MRGGNGSYRLDYKGLAVYIDVPHIIDRIKNLKDCGRLNDTQEIAINQLLEEFRKNENVNADKMP